MIDQVEATALKLYLPNPYHNARHPQVVWNRVQGLIERCHAFGLQPNEEVLHHATFIHDILTGVDFRRYGYRSAESLSAHVGMNLLVSCGVPVSIARESAKVVMGTHPSVVLSSLEQKVLRAADLGGLSLAFDDYLLDFYALKTESGEQDDLVFFAKSIKQLAKYLVRAIRLTPQYYTTGGVSQWHINVLSNLIANYRRICSERGMDDAVVLDLGCGSNPIGTWRPLSGLTIGVEPDSRSRDDAVRLALASRGLLSEIIVPGTGDAIPLPDHSLSRVIMANTALIHPDSLNQNELGRVLSCSAKLEIMEWYSPGLGFGEDFVKAKEHLKRSLSEGFQLDSEQDLACVQGANSDAFALIFSKKAPTF